MDISNVLLKVGQRVNINLQLSGGPIGLAKAKPTGHHWIIHHARRAAQAGYGLSRALTPQTSFPPLSHPKA